MMSSIELAVAEKELLGQIKLDALALSGHVEAKRNGELTAALMELLLTRKDAIPSHRIYYFTKPEYNVGGRGSSRQQIFERNGTSGKAIFHHPHFLTYLRYFVHGPDLPLEIRIAFQKKIEDCGYVTSSDILPLAKLARQLTRTHGLNPRDASEEFFKLALEHDLGTSCASTIRSQVRTIR